MTTVLFILMGLVFISQVIYHTKPFISNEDDVSVYYGNRYMGIAFIDITRDFRLFGWQWYGNMHDKSIFICNIAITFVFLMKEE